MVVVFFWWWWWCFFGGGGGVFLVVVVVVKCISINTPCIMRYAMGCYISTFAANCTRPKAKFKNLSDL